MSDVGNSKLGEYASFVSAWMMLSIVGFQFTYLNPSLPAIGVVFNETYTERYSVPMSDETWLSLLTVTTSAIVIGAFIGTCISTPLVNNMSRKHVMQLCHVVHIVGVIIVALIGGLTKSYEAFILGRVIIGLPAGVIFNIGPVIIGELCAKNRQSFWQSIPSCAMNFGILISFVFGHPKVLGSPKLWPVVSSLTILPSIIYLISSIFIPNTPAYLVRNGNEAEALKALKLLRKGSEKSITSEFNEIVTKVKEEKIISVRELFFRKKYRRSLILVFALYTNIIFCGINGIGFYSDNLFIRAGLPPQNVTYISIGIFFIAFFCAISGALLVKRIGPNTMLNISNIGIVLAIVLYTISRALAHLAPTGMSYLTIASVSLFLVFWSGGVAVVSFSLLALITTESNRPTAMGIGSILFFFTSWVTAFIIPYLMEHLGAYSSVPWLVCTILYTIFFNIFLPETNGKTEEEIQAQMQCRKKSVKCVEVAEK